MEPQPPETLGPPAPSPQALRLDPLTLARRVFFQAALAPNRRQAQLALWLQNTLKRALGRAGAGRALTVYPEDVFLVSYPKSGNTWVRFLAANLVGAGEPATFGNLEQRVPDIEGTPDQVLRSRPRPRCLKSHQYFHPAFRRVVYLVRDPRAVVVAYYHHHLKYQHISEAFSLERYAAHFLRGELDAFGTWGDNVAGWLRARRGTPDFLLLRYEDLVGDTRREARRLADFLGCQPSEARLDDVLRLSSREQMAALERQESAVTPSLRHGRRDLSFVRPTPGQTGRQPLPPEWARRIEAAWADPMRELGYLA
jgi:hypothetical protein